ncbi:MAG: beta-lactamase family protein [Candidatus Eisenbacteria bacterium]|uniref:Beta-lactamase family protein n=1 Tax=Eiseniibacteriota bacterium TaxID=2212470 RepID=A0A849SKG4_UNCEI|nr:beta-lactamase family protein [Candidatus Eisenbacteria bacterium]
MRRPANALQMFACLALFCVAALAPYRFAASALAAPTAPRLECSAAVPYRGGRMHAPPDSGVWSRAARSIDDTLGATPARHLNAELDTLLTLTRSPGITAAVGIPGRGHWSAHRGLARSKPRRELTEDSQFYWASAGKSFTAVIVLQLVQEGRLSLADSIARWFPDFPNARVITIDHLLTHTGGVNSQRQPTEWHRHLGYRSPEAFIASAAMGGSEFCPGENWNYSNAGYVMLARIVEQLERRPFHEVVTARIVEPLGLRATHALAPREKWPQLVTGHQGGRPETRFDRTTPFGAGNIAATAGDLVIFWHAVLSGRLLRGPTVRAAFDRLYPMFSDPMFYGRGVMLFEVADGARHSTWLGHAGGAHGARAVVAYDVERDLYVAVALNDEGSAVAAAYRLLKAANEIRDLRGDARD